MTNLGYPLQWPAGRPRTAPEKRGRSAFRTSPGRARDLIIAEVRRLGGRDLVISTNIPLKKDGTPYAAGYRLDDEGVAAYFTHKGRKVVFACDRWWSMAENMHAIAKTIEALRGIERWGSGDMLDAAVSGFAALLAPIVAGMKRHWREVFGYGPAEPVQPLQLEERFRSLRSKCYSDYGGTPEKFNELMQARDEALQELG